MFRFIALLLLYFSLPEPNTSTNTNHIGCLPIFVIGVILCMLYSFATWIGIYNIGMFLLFLLLGILVYACALECKKKSQPNEKQNNMIQPTETEPSNSMAPQEEKADTMEQIIYEDGYWDGMLDGMVYARHSAKNAHEAHQDKMNADSLADKDDYEELVEEHYDSLDDDHEELVKEYDDSLDDYDMYNTDREEYIDEEEDDEYEYDREHDRL